MIRTWSISDRFTARRLIGAGGVPDRSSHNSYIVQSLRNQVKSATIAHFHRPCYARAMAKETAFKRWRKQVGLTQEQAAETLGLSRSMIVNFDAGEVRGTGEPAIPSLAVRRLMTVLADGQEPKPWPLK